MDEGYLVFEEEKKQSVQRGFEASEHEPAILFFVGLSLLSSRWLRFMRLFFAFYCRERGGFCACVIFSLILLFASLHFLSVALRFLSAIGTARLSACSALIQTTMPIALPCLLRPKKVEDKSEAKEEEKSRRILPRGPHGESIHGNRRVCRLKKNKPHGGLGERRRQDRKWKKTQQLTGLHFSVDTFTIASRETGGTRHLSAAREKQFRESDVWDLDTLQAQCCRGRQQVVFVRIRRAGVFTPEAISLASITFDPDCSYLKAVFVSGLDAEEESCASSFPRVFL